MGFSSEAGFFFPKALPSVGWPVLFGSEGRKLAYSPMRDGSIGGARQRDAFGKGF